MARTPIDEKIRLLLAKAESTTPEEAEALTEAAAKLMIRHGIDQAMIDARRAAHAAPEEVIEESIVFTGDHGTGLRIMASAVTKAFGTMRVLIHSNGRWSQTVYVIGYRSDVEQVMVLLASLQMQALVAMRAWWRGERYSMHRQLSQAQQRMAKRTFLVGFGQGAASRIRTAREVATRESDERVGDQTTAVVLANRLDGVDRWVGETYPNLSQLRSVAIGNYGREDGREAGLRANTGGTAVGENRRALN